jgi:hypothetical protein
MTLRAIYEKGQLRLLGSEKPTEGQEFTLVPDDPAAHRAKVRAALGDLLVQPHELNLLDDETIPDEVLAQEIEEAFKGLPPLSQTIIEERQEGY